MPIPPSAYHAWFSPRAPKPTNTSVFLSPGATPQSREYQYDSNKV